MSDRVSSLNLGIRRIRVVRSKGEILLFLNQHLHKSMNRNTPQMKLWLAYLEKSHFISTAPYIFGKEPFYY